MCEYDETCACSVYYVGVKQHVSASSKRVGGGRGPGQPRLSRQCVCKTQILFVCRTSLRSLLGRSCGSLVIAIVSAMKRAAVVDIDEPEAESPPVDAELEALSPPPPPQKRAPHLPRGPRDATTGLHFHGSLYWNCLSSFGGHGPCGNTVSLEELLQFDDAGSGDCAHTILMSSFGFDLDWLVGSFPVLNRIRVFLLQSATRDVSRPSFFVGNKHFHSPTLPPFGSNHGKLIIVLRQNAIRLAISTANLIPADYQNKLQLLYVQDFPLGPEQSTASAASAANDEFKEYLLDYLSRLYGNVSDGREQVQRWLLDPIRRRCSFTSAKVRLVTSVPGFFAGPRHSGPGRLLYGLERIADILRRLPVSQAPLVVNCSSVGKSTSEKWLLDQVCPAFARSSDMQLMWPTRAYALSSPSGEEALGHLFLNKSTAAKPFVASRLFRFELTTASGILSHAKCFTRLSDSDPAQLEFVLVTSANLSKAALGEYTSRGGLRILSFEIGVMALGPVASGAMPFLLPPREYLATDVPFTIPG